MNAEQLIGIARTLVAGDRGPLAMDESTPTCNKRFAEAGIPQTEEVRRDYWELIMPGTGNAQTMKQRAIERWENEGGDIPNEKRNQAW